MAQSSTGRIVMIVGGIIGGLGVLGCCGTCIVSMIFGGQQAAEERARYQPLVAACTGQPVPGAAAAVPGPARAVLVGDGGTIDLYSLPQEMRSTGVADTQRVVCEGPSERYLVESCDYDTGFVTGVTGGRNIVERYAYRQSVRIVAASTGQQIAARVFEGTPPDPCPVSAEFDDGGDTQTLYGDTVAAETVHAWLADVAAGRAL
jgi:hypothetical protein